MNITVLGSGEVGRTLAARISELGHAVVIGTREPAKTLMAEDVATWAEAHPEVPLSAYGDSVGAADLVVNATLGSAAPEVIALVGAHNLAGRILLDVSNPLDFSRGAPPSLLVKDTDSLAEQLQRGLPDTRVVKSLNTMSAHLMVNPAQLPEETSVFLAGDDARAKSVVGDLLREIGHRDIIDLGDLTGARGAEMWLPLWLRIWGALGTANFNIRVVRT